MIEGIYIPEKMAHQHPPRSLSDCDGEQPSHGVPPRGSQCQPLLLRPPGHDALPPSVSRQHTVEHEFCRYRDTLLLEM